MSFLDGIRNFFKKNSLNITNALEDYIINYKSFNKYDT